ncbi:MAG: hypothetical protein GC152_10945 [Alphaproteobacteria bacterium]|nr:hypothetical protein [Alphaproteobacteria bacterium]
MSMLIWIIALYVLAQIAISAWVARRTRTDADYLVAGRRLGVFPVGMSLFATWFAAESVIATSAETAMNGLAGARIEPFAFGLGILLLGLFVAKEIRKGGHMTLADYIGARFGVAAETLSALAIALSGTVWAAAQLYALATIIAGAVGTGFLPALVAATAVVLVYTLIGGLMGDIATDIIQGAVLVVGVLILFFLILSASGGIGAAIDAVPPARLNFTAPGESILDQIEIWLIPIFASIVAQEAISRTLAARTPEIARNGAVLGSAIYVVVGLVPVMFGLFAPQLDLALGEGDQFLPSLAEALLPSWAYVVFTGALLSAILSSVDSALLAVSAVATETGYRRFRPRTTPEQSLVVARLATTIAGLVAFAVAASGESLREIVLSAASVGGVLAAPILLTIVSQGKFGGPIAATASIAIQIICLGVLDWTLGISGAVVITFAAGFATYIGLALAAFLARSVNSASAA